MDAAPRFHQPRPGRHRIRRSGPLFAATPVPVPFGAPSASAAVPRLHHLLFLISLLLALAGCSTPATPPEALPPDLPQAFRSVEPDVAPSSTADARWWTIFADPVLDALVARSLVDNTAIRMNAARLSRALATARVTGAGRSLQASAGASGDRLGGPLENRAGTDGALWTLGVGLSYELDLAGRLAREHEAARLDAAAAASLLGQARLLVEAAVVQSYLQLRLLDEERAIVRGTLVAWRETLALAERRFASGSVSELDVVRLRGEVASVDAERVAHERRRTELEHSLAVLAGTYTSGFAVPESAWQAPLPVIPAGIPSMVLARRPDIAAVQRAAAAARAREGAARAAWFPALSLTASDGFASSDLRDLLGVASRAWGVGALLSLPLLDGGRRQAAIDGAGADVDAALARQREQVLVAFQEVDDQLSALRTLAEQAELQDLALSAASRARALAGSRYRNGFASQLEVLDAQRVELRNRRLAVQIRAQRYQATVLLVRALGGGWQAPVAAAPGAAVLSPDARLSQAVPAPLPARQDYRP